MIKRDLVSEGEEDELYETAIKIIKTEKKASTSFLQRKLQIGYNRAARIIEKMEGNGLVSKANHVGKREVCNFLLKIKVIKILIFLILSFNFTILKADIKKNIIEKINNSETLKFEFIQISNNKDEDGVCYIKRPHFLKCEYDSKKSEGIIR